MNFKIYKSSIFDRVLYSFFSAGVLIPSMWLILYGLNRYSYNMPIILISILSCSYTIYLMQKAFSYKVLVNDDFIQIIESDHTFTIKYEDIIEIIEKRNACYLIDRINIENEYYIRGTKPALKCSEVVDSVNINRSKIAVLRRNYVENYHELINHISSKCIIKEAERENVRNRGYIGKSLFASTALLSKADYEKLSIYDTIRMFYPYFMLLTTFLMCLVEYGVLVKGNVSLGLFPYTKLIFPLFVVITIYILTINCLTYVKRLLCKGLPKPDISALNVTIFMVMNIGLSGGIIMLFFSMLNRISL